MADYTLAENITQAIKDIESIRSKLTELDHYVSYENTPSSQFAGIMGSIVANINEGHRMDKWHINESLVRALLSGGAGGTSTEMYDEPLETNINRAVSDITAIKALIEKYGVKVPTGTLSSTYDESIEQIIGDERTAGIKQGKQSAYDECWDDYTQNGTRRDYTRAFEGPFWTQKRFNPNREIIVGNGNYMFLESRVTDISNVNLTSELTGTYQMCRNCTTLTKVGNMNPSHQNMSQVFYGCSKLKEVGTVRVNANMIYDNSFYDCTSLVDITFAGTIGQSLDIQYSPLNKASIESIIGCLSTTATGKTLTLKKSAVNKAFETSEGTADGSTSTEWITLITPKSNNYDGTWTISLV